MHNIIFLYIRSNKMHIFSHYLRKQLFVPSFEHICWAVSTGPTNARCVDDIMYINVSLFESDSNSMLFVPSFEHICWAVSTGPTNARCVDDIMYINVSLFESDSNSMLCTLFSASKLVLCVGKWEQLIKSEFRHQHSLMYIFDMCAVLVAFFAAWHAFFFQFLDYVSSFSILIAPLSTLWRGCKTDILPASGWI